MDIAIPCSGSGPCMNAAVRSPAAWYAGFALYAAGVALFSGRGLDRWWGIWAAGGYALAVWCRGKRRHPWPSRTSGVAVLAAVAALAEPRAVQAAALAVAVAGALAAPLVWLATREPITPDALVVGRSGVLLLHHGTPYLRSAAARPAAAGSPITPTCR